MQQPELAPDLLLDLLRSAWVVETSRAEVYEIWGDPRRADLANERAALVETVLDASGGRTDPDLVRQHSNWLRSLVGDAPDEVALGNLLLARLGDWSQSHTDPFLGHAAERMAQLGDQEKSAIEFPSSFPSPPDFQPLEVLEVEPPGGTTFRVGILGDAHFGSAGAAERMRAAIADLNDSGAELVIQLGDITDTGERDQFEEGRAILAGLKVPFATMMGNHDVWSQSEGRLAGREYYGATFGREPDGVVLDHKGFKFAVLDSIEYGASPFGPFDLVTGSFAQGPRGAIVRGALTHPQHDLLADIAGPGGGPAFIFLHHPPQPFWGFPPIIFGLRETDSGRLHAVVDSGNVWGVFAGHTHRCAHTRDFDGVPAMEVGIPRDFPFGYALLDIGDHGYSYRFRQISDEALLRDAYEGAGDLLRRYGGGAPEARSFTWTVRRGG